MYAGETGLIRLMILLVVLWLINIEVMTQAMFISAILRRIQYMGGKSLFLEGNREKLMEYILRERERKKGG